MTYTIRNHKTGEVKHIQPLEETTLRLDEIVKSNGEEWQVINVS